MADAFFVVRAPAERIVSLVPSLTETVIALGAAARLSGVTEWCPGSRHAPATCLPPPTRLPAFGGTKNPDVAGIVALAPDLVLASREENREADVRALEASGLEVWLSDPRAPADVPTLVLALGERLGRAGEAAALGAELRAALGEVRRTAWPRWRYVQFIWRKPWWVTGQDTYAAALLAEFGGENALGAPPARAAGDTQLPPRQGSDRYFSVTEAEVVAARPDVLLFPDEPLPFSQAAVDAWRVHAELPAVRHDRLVGFPGRLVTWPGYATLEALRALPDALGLSPAASPAPDAPRNPPA